MAGVDDIVGQWIKRAEKTGELKNGSSWRKPMDLSEGKDTPEKLRMAHRMLKNAGYVPVEVEKMQQVAALKDELKSAESEQERARLRRKIANLRQELAIFMSGAKT